MPTEDDWKDPIVLSENAKRQLAADPELAAACRELFANMRQAHLAVREGRYATFDDAMEAITGERPTPLVPSEDDE